MSRLGPYALLLAFALNVMSVAVVADRQQGQHIDAEVRYRGAPGPAEVERFEAAGFDVAPTSASAPGPREPSRATVTQTLSQLGSATTALHEGAFPVSAGCASGRQWAPEWPTMALGSAHLLEQGHHEQSCKGNHHPVGVVSADQKIAQQDQAQLAREHNRVHAIDLPASRPVKTVRMSPRRSGIQTSTLERTPSWVSVAE